MSILLTPRDNAWIQKVLSVIIQLNFDTFVLVNELMMGDGRGSKHH